MSEFKRQHPVAAITSLLGMLRQNIVPIAIFLVVGSRNTGEYFWYFFMFGILSTLVLGIFGWLLFTYRVVGDELQINKGILIRKKLYLTKDRIQVIDITEGILQRMFGLVKVEVKSAGSGTESATISAITREEAEELRSVLRGESTSSIQSIDIEHDFEVETIAKAPSQVWHLPGKDLLLAALTSGNFGVIASILGAVSGQLEEFINVENIEYITRNIPGLDNTSVYFALFLFIFIVSYVLSFIGVILKYSDFKIEKNDKELTITSGLLERKHITVPFNRIQAVRFVEGVLRQPFGFGMLYAESAGYEKQNQEKSIVLLPFVKKEYLEEFFSEFLNEYTEPETDVTPPKKALFKYLRRPNYMVLILVSVLWIFWEHGWLLYSLIVPFSLLGWIRFKDAELGYTESVIKLQYRVLAKTTAILRRNRTQVAEMSINPFQKRKDLASVKLTAASGAGGRAFEIYDLEYNDALSVFKWPVEKEEVDEPAS